MKRIIVIILLIVPQVAFSSDIPVIRMTPNVCVPGVIKQPNGPFAIYAFCDDALGTNIAVFLDELGTPFKGEYTLADRFWQRDEWCTDITSFAWLPDGKRLVVATSGIYGSGKVYVLTLESRKFKVVYDPEDDTCVTEIMEIKDNRIILKVTECESDNNDLEIGMRDVHENMKREMSNESSDSYFHVRPLSLVNAL